MAVAMALVVLALAGLSAGVAAGLLRGNPWAGGVSIAECDRRIAAHIAGGPDCRCGHRRAPEHTTDWFFDGACQVPGCTACQATGYQPVLGDYADVAPPL